MNMRFLDLDYHYYLLRAIPACVSQAPPVPPPSDGMRATPAGIEGELLKPHGGTLKM